MKALTYNVLIWLFTLASITTVFGQGKFAVSVQVAPVYVYADNSITFPFPNAATQQPSTEITIVSRGLNYSLGITGRYAFSPKWSASTGIWATHPQSATTDFTQNGISSSIRYTYSRPFANRYKAPLLINYQSSARRLSPYFSAGATFDFRGTSYVDLTGNGEWIPVKFGKAVVVTPLVGIGAIYRLKKHLLLIAQPTFQYDIQARPGYSYYHAYQLSLQTQLMYPF